MRIELKRVTKIHASRGRKVHAVDGVDLVIEPGELLVLLGPSGCGKSTLLEILAGLESPTSGTILFDGEIAADAEKKLFTGPKERGVAMVFQSYALYPHLTVAENIGFPLRVAGAREPALGEAVREAASAVQIENLLTARPSELSGGQRQRVAIARALVRKPSLFLMDEPLSNLDARLRLATRAKIKALQRNLGVTTVYVTHDQQEAMALGDRVAILNQGRIEQLGTPAEIFDNPATAFAARFAGHPPMNLLRVEAQENAEGPGWQGPVLALPGTTWFVPGRPPRGSTALLGIRPEHVSFVPAHTPGAIPAKVAASEKFGRDQLVHVEIGEITLSALVTGQAPAIGDSVGLILNPNRMKIYPDDGEVG